jgi:hypothetical protein
LKNEERTGVQVSSHMIILLRVFAVLFAIWWFVLGLIMLVSPQACWRLPIWLRGTGSLPKEKYSKGWGAIQIRMMGALMIGVLIWVIYDAFWSPRIGGFKANAALMIVGSIIIGIVVLQSLINALFMIISPLAWYRLPCWIRIRRTLFIKEEYSSKSDATRLRIIGFLIIGIVALVTWTIFHQATNCRHLFSVDIK